MFLYNYYFCLFQNILSYISCAWTCNYIQNLFKVPHYSLYAYFLCIMQLNNNKKKTFVRYSRLLPTNTDVMRKVKSFSLYTAEKRTEKQSKGFISKQTTTITKGQTLYISRNNNSTVQEMSPKERNKNVPWSNQEDKKNFA